MERAPARPLAPPCKPPYPSAGRYEPGRGQSAVAVLQSSVGVGLVDRLDLVLLGELCVRDPSRMGGRPYAHIICVGTQPVVTHTFAATRHSGLGRRPAAGGALGALHGTNCDGVVTELPPLCSAYQL